MGLLDLFRKKECSVLELNMPEPTIDELRQRTNILFIDDKEFPVVDILKNNGWLNTSRVEDVRNLFDVSIKNAHIIFVDINGVGKEMAFADEGLGLVRAIKERHPEKYVVVYSAEPAGDRFNEGLAAADSRLRKNAEPIQFLSVVEKYSRDCFSPDSCVARIQEALRKEFGLILSHEDIRRNIARIKSGGDTSEAAVSSVFNVDRIGSVASIIGLLLTINA